MRKTIRPGRWIFAAVLISSVTACDRAFNPAAPSAGNAPPALLGPAGSGAGPDIEAVRRSTARFHDLDQAKAAGWDTPLTGCQQSAAGGQGVHYGKLASIDGVVNLLEPELLMYEPRGDGTWHFVGVEYIVPIPAWASAAPPSLFGETFHRNDALGLWVLHLWIWKPNPSGLFADWNPLVSCG